MPGTQRILVVSTTAREDEVVRARRELGRSPVVITAPTGEAARLVQLLGSEPQVELLLAPVRFPPVDRGHQLDALLRRHALRDRFRDVVVVSDPATSTLLLRVLAPDQLPSAGAVSWVGLARGERPVAVRRGVVAGVVVGIVALVVALPNVLLLPGVVALVGLGLVLARPWRHLGQELLIVASVAAAVVLLLVASSARFPGAQ
ncbi:hypothetical protein ABLE68_08795 [Nocardioides sp. CN2-186]|uniref:hypothetical protein n=1 Tax=Nocardioides tweenelious TaxID=3156607 RepID=UPI0032B626FA